MVKPKDNNNAERQLESTLEQNIPRTAWITLAILGSTLLIAMYGETMLLPAIPDIIRDFDYFFMDFISIPYLRRCCHSNCRKII
jgi:hypothetical protein